MATTALLASGGVRAVGDIYSSQAQAASAGFNAKIADQNAKLATQNAEWTGAEGEQKVGLAGLQGQQIAGKIKVAQAANGVDVNSGSAVAVQKSSAEMSMLNEMNIRSNAARQAYGYESQAVSDQAQAALDRSAQSKDKIAGYIGATGSLLGSAGQAAMYNDWLGTKGLGGIVGSGVSTDEGMADSSATSSGSADFMKQAYPNF